MNWNSQVNILRSDCAKFVTELSTFMGVIRNFTSVMPHVVNGYRCSIVIKCLIIVF